MFIREIRGQVILPDGSESEFRISGSGRQQWGATTARLGKTVDVMDAMTAALEDAEILFDDEEGH